MTEQPAYYKCTASKSPLFRRGHAYEVFRYDEQGNAEIINEKNGYCVLPVQGVTFEPYAPWGEPEA